MKKILSIMLAVCMLLSIVPMAVFAVEEADIFASGDGTSAATAYTIATLEQLEAFRDAVDGGNDFSGKFIKLTADIDMSSKYGEGKASWNPIGSNTKEFNGTFDGDGHSIDELYINSTNGEDYCQGLFAIVGVGGCVKNLSVSGSVTATTTTVAGIAAGLCGTIENCHNSCDVSGNMNVGGITGDAQTDVAVTISGCSNSGAIKGTGSYVGGIFGNYNFNNGTQLLSFTIKNCLNTGEVSGTGDNIGGIGGSVEIPYLIQNCLNTGLVTGSGSGGIFGYCFLSSAEQVKSCYYLDTSASTGIYDGNSSTSATTLTSEQLTSEENFVNWDFTDTWVMNYFLGRPTLRSNPENSIKGDGKTAATAFEISNLAELEAFRDAVDGCNDFGGQFVKLTADIDMSSKYGEGKASWNPIGESNYDMLGNCISFNGTFDGCGHKIDKMYIIINDDSKEINQGLFSYVEENGTVKNLTVGGSIINNSPAAVHAGIVARNKGVVENCCNACSIIGGNSGGIVGVNDAGTIKKCYNIANISGVSASGIVECGDGMIENCYNIGEISGSVDAAGITEAFSGTINNCYNIGKIISDAASSITCYNSGNVEYCYYLDSSCSTGISDNSGTGSATAKTAAEFASGEVAYLLQNEVADDDGQIWGQTLTGESKDASPVLSSELSKKVCLVKFINFDGERHAKFFINYNGTVTLPTDPTVDSGYKFDGWFVVNSTTAFTSSTLVTGDISLYPKQSLNTFTVTYKDGKDGAIFSDQTYTVSNGDATPSFVGELGNVASYVFKGWDKTVAATVTQSVTYTAKWSDKSANTLRLLGNGGTTASGATISDSYTNAASIATGANSFTKTGYTFKEWNTKADGKGTSYAVGATVNFTAIHNAETVTLYAIWTVKGGYKIAFNDVLTGVMVKDGVKWTDTVLDGMGDMKRDGYTFDGWFRNGTKITSDMTYGDLAVTDTTMKITLTAKWTDIENPVISGIENGKTYCSAQTVTVTDNGIIKSVTVNGKGVDLDENGKFTLNPTAGEQEIIVTDTDGNTATVKVTVNDGHTGGTATCCDKAVCEICNTPYGDLNPENHTGEKVWTADDENHEQKWDCCGETVVKQEEHDYKWGICEECGYEHAHRIGFAIWSFLKNAVSLVVKVVVGLIRFIKELNVFDFPCLR